MESVIRGLAKLGEMITATEQEIFDFALGHAIACTESTVGYLAVMNDDETAVTMSWSKSITSDRIIENIPCPVVNTGWAECVRWRGPIITNDGTAIKRINVPVFDHPLLADARKIVLVAGVGNKSTDYDDLDGVKLTIFMQSAWRIICHKRVKANLELLVKEKTASLTKSIEDLNRSNEELRKFAYVASHDLKAPLRAVVNLVDWIAEDAKQGKDVSSYVEKLTSRVKRMEDLINGLLEYSRVGRTNTETELVDVAEAIDKIKEESMASQIAVEGKLPCIQANYLRLSQVLANLIGNAFQHHHDVQNALVSIRCDTTENEHIFCVSDNGPGIERQYHGKIFEIFQTLKPRDELESTGIGLAIVARIVQDWKGRVWVDSDLGKGAKFYFSIPK